jgi:hypothetical protein
MKIYLAARYSRRQELCLYRAELQAMDHAVTSRWLNGNHQVPDDGMGELTTFSKSERERFASEDWEDLMAAETCISFTEKPREMNSSRGGRHVEFGAAMAAGKRIIVIGFRENVFHCLPQVEFYETWQSFLKSELVMEALTI